MFRDIPRYKAYYRPIDWIDPIPAHWSRRRFGTLLREKDIRSLAGEEQLLRVSQYTGVTERRTESGEGVDSRSDSLVGYKRVKKGQLAVNIMLAWNGSLGVSLYDGIVSPAYCVYSFKDHLEPWFFHYLLRSPQLKARIRAYSRGIVDSRLRLYSDDLYRLEAGVPPVEEQSAIVKYLTHANARIEKAILAKRRLRELLREQRAKRREEVVLRGVDQSVVFRDSGVKWIGATPEHWRIVRLKHVAQNLDSRRIPLDSVTRGKMTSRRYDYYGASGAIDKVDDFIFDETLVLLAEDGANLVLRNLPLVIRVDGKCWVNNHAHVLRVFDADVDYLVHRLTGAAQPKLTADRLMSISISLPPLSEQQAIVKQLSVEFAEIDRVIKRLGKEIGFLQEFRTRLVADVVTGQVDGRAIAASLPETPEQDTDLDSLLDDDIEDVLGEGEE